MDTPQTGDRELDDLIELAVKSARDHGATGGAIVVYANGELHHEVFGTQDETGCVPVTLHTRFNGQMIAQLGVTLAVLRHSLGDDAVPGLDQPITEKGLLPDLALTDDSVAGAFQLTLQNLLEQKSGYTPLRILTDDGCPSWLPQSAQGSEAEGLEEFFDDFIGWIASEPGTQYSISVPSFLLAARVLEVALGERFESVFRKSVAEPAGLTATYEPDVVKRGELAASASDPFQCGALRPTHGLYLTIEDLGKLLRSLATGGGDGVLSSEEVRHVLGAPGERTRGGVRGMGLFDTPLPPTAGMSFQTRAALAVVPDRQVAFGFLQNHVYSRHYMSIIDKFVELYVEDAHEYDYSTDRAQWAEYDGTYAHAGGSLLTVTAVPSANLLRMRLDGYDFELIPSRFVAWSPSTTLLGNSYDADTFHLKGKDSAIENVFFYRDAQGQPDQIGGFGDESLVSSYRRVR